MVSGLIPFILSSLGFATSVCADTKKFQSRHFALPRLPTAFKTVPQADFSLPLIGKSPRQQVKRDMLRSLLGESPTIAVLAGSAFDQQYLVNVTIGGQQFALIVDTGSSDTWVVGDNFTCLGLNSTEQPQSECAFGPLFYPNTSSTFSPLPDLNFNITYESDEFLLGTVANETVTIAGLTVEQQEIGVVYKAAWEGDGVNSGILGLAYPIVTRVFTGDDPTNDTDPLSNSIKYDPFFFSAVREGAVSAPFFSVALNRPTLAGAENGPSDPNLGYLGFGGLPPVTVTNVSVTVPIQGYQISPLQPSNASNAIPIGYSVDIQAYTFPGSDKIDTFTDLTFFDTGSGVNYLSTDIVNLLASEIDPPATYYEPQSVWVVQCNATAPEMFVTIGNTVFSIDPRDQIIPVETDEAGDPICILGTQDGGNGTVSGFTLGDPFMNNVVLSFNIESNEITITQRQNY